MLSTNTNIRPFVVSISGIYKSGSHLPCHNDCRRLNFSLTQKECLNSQETKEPSIISNNLTFLKARQVNSSGEVLLVGEDQHGHSLSLGQPVSFFIFASFLLPLDQPANPLQLQLGLLQPLLVARVHDEDDRVRGACVRPPEGPRLVLPSDVPDVEDPT